MDLAARLDALRANSAGRQQLADALRSALPKGVRTATEFFRDKPDPPSPLRLADVLTDLMSEERASGRILLRTQSVEITEEGGAHSAAYYLPLQHVDSLEDAATLRLVFPDIGEVSIDPTRVAFFDTETTGLSGGTGTIAFLAGIGWLERDASTGRIARFTLEQLLVEDFGHEPAMLERLAQHLERFDAVCTYNGRGFDVPLMRTRFAMNRMSRNVWRKPNLDLLPFARRLWRSELGNARLSTVERGVFGIERVGDIDGSQVPTAWHEWARTGAPGLMPAVMTHNAQDIASLVSILARQLAIARSPEDRTLVTRTGECLGLARWCEKRRDYPLAGRLCERALSLMPDPGSDVRLLLHLARLHRRNGCDEQAIDIWRELERRPLRLGLTAWLEHARHLEHRTRDLPAAQRLVHRCLSQAEMENDLHRYSGRSGAIPVSPEELDALRRRLARLDRRVEKAASAPLRKKPAPRKQP